MTYDLAIVGAGASGLAAAMAAGRIAPAKRILLLERLPRAGKKLLATGNGRCNLSNRRAPAHGYHNRGFAAPALEQFDAAACEAFFDSLGLKLCEDADGRLYPRSNMAASVLDALRFGAQRAGAELRCDFPVENISTDGRAFLLNRELLARKVILAAGGCAAPAQGSDGSGFTLLRALGHCIVEPRPALVQIKAHSPVLAMPKMLKGLRVRAGIKITQNGKVLRASAGEILFTEDGLSGVAAMEVSRAAFAGTAAVLDLLPEMPLDGIIAALDRWRAACPEAPPAQLLAGLLPKRVGEAVLRTCENTSVEYIAKACKNFTFTVTGTRGFAHAQVTAGGADVREFDPHTLESRLVPGLYACGEVLDVDGGCGGFNLHWAWASGVMAGFSSCANKPNHRENAEGG